MVNYQGDAFDPQVNSNVNKEGKGKALYARKVNGENQTAFDNLSHILQANFTLLQQDNLTRTIKHTDRHFEVELPHLSVWQLK